MDKLLTKSFSITLNVVLIGMFCPFMAFGKSLNTPQLGTGLSNPSRLVYIRNQEALINQVTKDRTTTRSSGGDVGGGGTTVFWAGQRKLIDIFDIKTDIKNASLDRGEIAYGRFTKIDLKKTRLNSVIQTSIQGLIPLAPKFAASLKQVYNLVPFYFARGQFTFVSDSFELDPRTHYPADAMFSTAAFNIQNFCILISGDQFIEMDFDNQVALVIHEIVRSLQIQFSFEMSHREIQELTAAIVTGNRLQEIVSSSSLVKFLEELSFNPLVDSTKAATEIPRADDIEISPFMWLDFKNATTWLRLSKLEQKQRLDQIAAEMNEQGYNAVSSQKLNFQARAQSYTFLRDRGNFMAKCSEENYKQYDCQLLLKILSDLIH